MLSSLSFWTSRAGNDISAPTSIGSIALDTNFTYAIDGVPSDPPGRTSVSKLAISVSDKYGNSWLRPLANVKVGDQLRVTIDPTADVDANLSWQVGVSGTPVYYDNVDIPYFLFPVSSLGVNATTRSGVIQGESAWTPGTQTIEFESPPWAQATSFNTVSMPDTILTTWDASAITSRGDRWDTREGDIRKEIYKMTQAKNNISFIYKESLRSMIASFNDVGYIDSEEKFNSIMCIHANAERAIAKLKQENNIILPIISVGQTTSDNDSARQKTESLLVNEKYWDAKKNKAYRILSLAPRAVNVKYQVNIWTKYMSDMDQILEQIRLKFNPEMQVPTEFSTLAKAYLDSEDDVGQITVSDKQDRVLKKTMNIVLRTYIPSPKFLYTSTGKIEEFKIETGNC
jgi:hypothetical protein